MSHKTLAGIGLIVFAVAAAIASIPNQLYVRLFKGLFSTIDISVTISMILITVIGIAMIIHGKKYNDKGADDSNED